MKKIFCALVLSILCLSGCSNNKTQENLNITQCMKKDDAQKLDVISTLGEPSGEDITNEYESYTWNKYELLKGYTGVLQFNVSTNIDSISWLWRITGDDKDYKKIYSAIINEFGKEYSDSTFTEGMGDTFSFKTPNFENCHNINLSYDGEVISVYWTLNGFLGEIENET